MANTKTKKYLVLYESYGNDMTAIFSNLENVCAFCKTLRDFRHSYTVYEMTGQDLKKSGGWKAID